MLLGGAVLAPLAIPVLPPETYVRYTKALGLNQPAIETRQTGTSSTDFRGSIRMGRDGGVGGECLQRPAAGCSRAHCDLRAKLRAGRSHRSFGPKYGLPPAISTHQSYFLWGPREYTGESMIVMDDRQEIWKSSSPACERLGACIIPIRCHTSILMSSTAREYTRRCRRYGRGSKVELNRTELALLGDGFLGQIAQDGQLVGLVLRSLDDHENPRAENDEL